MNIYHGSEHIIKKPEWGKGSSANDFGRGFYCTESIDLAKEWACKKNTNGFANQYELDTTGLQICNLNCEEYHILNWLALLTRYRGYWQKGSVAEEAKRFLQEKYLVDISAYDVIIGYRADDSYFSFAKDFITGTISLQVLSKAMRLGKLGEQIVLKSPKAFDNLSYEGYETAEPRQYFVKKESRDRMARNQYRLEKSNDDYANGIFILDILRGRVSDDDLRI